MTTILISTPSVLRHLRTDIRHRTEVEAQEPLSEAMEAEDEEDEGNLCLEVEAQEWAEAVEVREG